MGRCLGVIDIWESPTIIITTDFDCIYRRVGAVGVGGEHAGQENL